MFMGGDGEITCTLNLLLNEDMHLGSNFRPQPLEPQPFLSIKGAKVIESKGYLLTRSIYCTQLFKIFPVIITTMKLQINFD